MDIEEESKEQKSDLQQDSFVKVNTLVQSNL